MLILCFSQAVEYRKAVRSPMHPEKRLTFVRSCCNKAANIFFYVIIIKSVRSIATTYVMYHSWTIILPTCNYQSYSFQCSRCSSPSLCILSNPCCLSASYNTIATELDRFRERISGSIGIRMQAGAGSHTGSSNISGVCRDLRLV